MLCALLVPSLAAARRHSRMGACAAGLHVIGAGLMSYAAESKMRMPPFAFSSYKGNLPLSGHWGGGDDPNDPDLYLRSSAVHGMGWVNLYALCMQRFVSAGGLVCPGADLKGAGLFPRTGRASSYCLRFPYSEDLFARAPGLAWRGKQLLGAYYPKAGGQTLAVGANGSPQGGMIVPLVQLNERYINADTGSTFDPGVGAIAADQFLYQDMSSPAQGADSAVRRSWCHGSEFNVLRGNGAVASVADDGTVAANSVRPGGALVDDGKTGSTYAEKIWRFFESRK